MREIVGFVAGIATGATATAIARSESGRRLRERLLTEADPELRAALTDWDPLVQEVARAVRLAAREIDDAVGRVAGLLSEIAAIDPPPVPDDDVAPSPVATGAPQALVGQAGERDPS